MNENGKRLCSRCGVKMTSDLYSSSTQYYCKNCFREKQQEYKEERKKLIKERGDIKEHRLKVLYLIRKIEINNNMVDFKDINDILTLTEYTFLRRNNVELSIEKIFNKLKNVSQLFPEYNKEERKIIDLR